MNDTSPSRQIVAKHTPGPWIIGTPSPAWGEDVDYTVRAQDGEAIAWVISRRGADNDARLIAAAPEMFEVLSNLYDDLVRYSKMTEEVWSSGSIAFGSMADSIHAVLARARGEASDADAE